MDRAYLYDNSIENADAQIIARFTDAGAFGKQYVDVLPRWAKYICGWLIGFDYIFRKE